MGYDREKAVALAGEVIKFFPDVAKLFRDVAKDDRVSRRVKIEAGAALAYVVSPIDFIPDFIPGIGQLDDLAVIAWGMRRLLLGAGEPLIRELWSGNQRALNMLLELVATGLRPHKLLFRRRS